MGVTQFLYNLFRINEQLPPHKKMTNAEIERQLRVEYAAFKRTISALDHKRMSVNAYRHKYNAGVIIKPPFIPEGLLISQRYDDKGFPVDTRTGKKRITADALKAQVDKYHPFWSERSHMDSQDLWWAILDANSQHLNIEMEIQEYGRQSLETVGEESSQDFWYKPNKPIGG